MKISFSIEVTRNKHPAVTKRSNNYAAVRFEPLDKEENKMLQSMSSSLPKSSSANTS